MARIAEVEEARWRNGPFTKPDDYDAVLSDLLRDCTSCLNDMLVHLVKLDPKRLPDLDNYERARKIAKWCFKAPGVRSTAPVAAAAVGHADAVRERLPRANMQSQNTRQMIAPARGAASKRGQETALPLAW
jgi:hypothetical protein